MANSVPNCLPLLVFLVEPLAVVSISVTPPLITAVYEFVGVQAVFPMEQTSQLFKVQTIEPYV